MTQDFWIDPYSVHWGANSHSCRTWSISRWITYQKDVKMVIFPHSCVKLPEGTSIMCSAKNVKRVGCRHHFLDGKKSFFAHSQWDWQIEFIFLKWKFFDGWGSESEGGTKTLAPKFHGILLHPRMQSTAFCPQHQRCWGDVVRFFLLPCLNTPNRKCADISSFQKLSPLHMFEAEPCI